MTEFRRLIEGRTFTVRCDDHLRRQAAWLLSAVEEMSRSGKALEDGARVQFGWSVLEFRRDRDGSVLVCEPDFDGDPLGQVVDSVTRTLDVLAEQNDVLNRLGITGYPVRFDQRVVVDPRCLSEPRVFLGRGQPSDETDSGWYMGSDTDPSSEESIAIPVYELLTRRRAALKAMPLPPGYLVVIDGNSVASITDGDDVERWAVP